MEHQFLTFLKEELQARYPWALIPDKLNKFMDSAKSTMNGEKSMNLDGDAIRAAWKRSGGKGKPTYKGLHAWGKE